jgi:hypothetical protein
MCADDAHMRAHYEGAVPDLASFSHRDHLQLGFEMLRSCSFTEAADRVATLLKETLRKVGRPDAFHETITVAFLAIIAERMNLGAFPSFDAFVNANSDLLDKFILEQWYSRQQLESAQARKTFVLPEPKKAQ